MLGKLSSPELRYATLQMWRLGPVVGGTAAGRAENVADAAHGLDKTWLVLFLERLAHRGDSDGEDVGFSPELVPPHPLHHGVVRQHLIRVLHQRRQEIELLGGEDDLSIATENRTRAGVEGEVLIRQDVTLSRPDFRRT